MFNLYHAQCFCLLACSTCCFSFVCVCGAMPRAVKRFEVLGSTSERRREDTGKQDTLLAVDCKKVLFCCRVRFCHIRIFSLFGSVSKGYRPYSNGFLCRANWETREKPGRSQVKPSGSMVSRVCPQISLASSFLYIF